MKPGRWGCCDRLLIGAAMALLALGLASCTVDPHRRGTAALIEPTRAEMLVSDAPVPPGDDAPWAVVTLPDLRGTSATWYRVAFEVPVPRADSWAVYLPYLYGGGAVMLNGVPVEQIAEATPQRHVRWERPHLVALPDSVLHSGHNLLHLRVAPASLPSGARLPALAIGAHAELLPVHERRLFWVHTMPQFTAIACAVVGAFVLFIWLGKREEVLYGLFAGATLFWGFRTLTFVVEVLPEAWWPTWRLLYHSANGGFVILMTLFTLRLAGWQRPAVERGLLLYWLLGPIAYLASGGSESLAGRLWIGGMIPVGLSMVVLTVVAAWRQRTKTMVALMLSVSLGVVAGVHDYAMAWDSDLLRQLSPHWLAHRIFLLHFGANLLLLVMGTVLTTRFLNAMRDLEELNRTLEQRVAARERELASNYERLSKLERVQAAADERAHIMRDMHDGLGSTLFTSLSRVERDQMSTEEVADALRACIAEMRLALEAMAPEDRDFLGTFGSFRFRWEALLQARGIRSQWSVDVPDERLDLTPNQALQVLRVLQEALTNALKHAGATQIDITLHVVEGRVHAEVADNGRGLQPGLDRPGRGLLNMRSRAQRLGGALQVDSQPGRTRIALDMPLAA